VDLSEGSKRKWVQRPDSAVYIFCGNLKVAMYPSSPASHHPDPYSLPPSFALLASTTPCVSGQISPTVGSAGLCGGLFILERGLPSGSLHLSKHPPGRCSVFPALHSLCPSSSSSSITRLIPTWLTWLSLTPSFCFITPSPLTSFIISICRHSFLPFLLLSLSHFMHTLFLPQTESSLLLMLIMLFLSFLIFQFLLQFYFYICHDA